MTSTSSPPRSGRRGSSTRRPSSGAGSMSPGDLRTLQGGGGVHADVRAATQRAGRARDQRRRTLRQSRRRLSRARKLGHHRPQDHGAPTSRRLLQPRPPGRSSRSRRRPSAAGHRAPRPPRLPRSPLRTASRRRASCSVGRRCPPRARAPDRSTRRRSRRSKKPLVDWRSAWAPWCSWRSGSGRPRAAARAGPRAGPPRSRRSGARPRFLTFPRRPRRRPRSRRLPRLRGPWRYGSGAGPGLRRSTPRHSARSSTPVPRQRWHLPCTGAPSRRRRRRRSPPRGPSPGRWDHRPRRALLKALHRRPGR